MSLFPLVTHYKLFYKYCRDINLFIRLKCRNFYSYVYGEISFAVLGPIGNHNNNCSYLCDNCKKSIKHQKQTEQEAKRRVLLDTLFYKDIRALPIEELTLKDALYLLSVVEPSASDDLEFVKTYLKGYSVTSSAPNEDLNDYIVGHLGHRVFVLINPSISSLDAFKFNQEKALTDDYTKFYGIFCLILKNKIINKFFAKYKGERSSSWKKEVSDKWHQIAKYEGIENLNIYLLT